MADSAAPTADKLIVAIDFGTTYSGVAWGSSTRLDRMQTITSWPINPEARRGNTIRMGKVPTQLRYPARGRVEWGYLVEPSAHADEVLRLIKLCLEPKLVPENSEAAGTVASIMAVHNVDSLIQDYLSGLLEHLFVTMGGEVGPIDGTSVEFMLAVPAIWTEKATQRTIKALERAQKFPRGAPVSVVSEPEAAAIYTLHRSTRHGMKVGQSFVVVDAGGGTVDLITYSINSLHPTLEVTESAPGSGGMCGSSLLNSRFIQFLDAKLGDEDGYTDDVRKLALDHFERDTKRKFSTRSIPHDTFSIPVPGVGRNREVGVPVAGRLVLKATELHMIFEPIVLQVIRLVKEQINVSGVPIAKIMLVGGFGTSTYLRERIQAAFQSGPQQRIEVIQPEEAWISVVQGALIKKISEYSPERLTQISIKSRAARKHYGTEVCAKYKEDKHSSIRGQRWYDGFYGTYRVRVMSWFIKRSEPVSEETPYYKHLCMTSRVTFGRPNKIVSEIHADDQSLDAPLTRDQNVKVLCVLEADLSQIPEDEIEQKRGHDGHMYYVIDFLIESVYTSASTSYTLIHKEYV
ncbi:hypothetical protein DL765_006646 [Monosporascus sp. GIB2]|nr:hypothetical protein DL765_006646 [Monosporascus sp. GIB2]